MKQLAKTALAFLLTMPTLTATAQTAPVDSGEVTGKWATWTDVAGGFSVELPGIPESSTEQVPFGNGHVTQYTAMCSYFDDFTGYVYMVTVVIFPEAAEDTALHSQLIKTRINELAQALEGKATLGDSSAKVPYFHKFTVAETEDETRLQGMTLMYRHVQFNVMVLYPENFTHAWLDPDRFISSFKVKGAAADKPANPKK